MKCPACNSQHLVVAATVLRFDSHDSRRLECPACGLQVQSKTVIESVLVLDREKGRRIEVSVVTFVKRFKDWFLGNGPYPSTSLED